MGEWDYYCFICAAGFNTWQLDESDDDDEVDENQEDGNEGNISGEEKTKEDGHEGNVNKEDGEVEGGSEENENGQDGTEEVRDEEDENEESDKGIGSKKNNAQVLDPRKLYPKDTVSDRLQWLSKFRTIGLNRNATGLTQCYLTGPATEDSFGQANIQRGEHPNAQNLPDECVSCYRDGEEENGDLPVHDNCFAILCKVFARAQGVDFDWTSDQTNIAFPFDLDALFSCLALTREEYACFLRLDHGFEPDQYFDIEWERIYDYFDPLQSPDLSLHAAKVLDPVASGCSSNDVTSDLFDSLPVELLMQILESIPPSDLVPLMRASKAVHHATKQREFWRRRLLSDAPWMWEYHESSAAQETDWQKCYSTVMMHALNPLRTAASGATASGLANRKRIWQVGEQILQMYLEPNILTARNTSPAVFENGVLCRYLPIVADRKDAQFSSQAKFFFHRANEMQLAKNLKLKWTTNGALSGIRLETEAQEVTLGDFDTSPGTESDLDIQPDDWINKMILNISVVESWKTGTPPAEKSHYRIAVTGVTICLLSGGTTVFGKREGCKRLLEPLPGNGIVGLKIQLAQGRITHLGLLEHSAGLTKARPSHDPKMLDLLWHDHLPSTELRFKDYYTGYWQNESRMDLVPMQALLFGSTDIEQSKVTGFSAAFRLRSFAIHRIDGSCEKIGSHEDPVKMFPIDGPGGERVAGFEITVGHLPVGLTLITTYGRQAVFGQRRNNARHGHTSDHGFGVAGLYASFEYGSSDMGKGQLSSLGLIQSPHVDRPPMNDVQLDDGNGLIWEPQTPPASWHTVGDVYGPKHNGEAAVCIDFSRPVEKITGLLPAPEWMAEIEIGGFTIRYSDDNKLEPSAHFGFTSEQWPTAETATPESLRAIQRYAGMTMVFTKEVDSGKAHVLTDQDALNQPTTWSLGQRGEKIVAVTVWAGDFLHGLQFHSESGKESPRWGKCGGEPAGMIRAGGKERIVGLKVIMGTKRLSMTASQLTPQAVQAMSDAPN